MIIAYLQENGIVAITNNLSNYLEIVDLIVPVNVPYYFLDSVPDTPQETWELEGKADGISKGGQNVINN